MSLNKRNLSEYRPMWLFVLFDLPVKTMRERREYTRFRNALLAEGFCMLQFSVYARYCQSEEASDAYRNHIRKLLPGEGQVRMVSITDRQFGKMEIFFGKKKDEPENQPRQLSLF